VYVAPTPPRSTRGLTVAERSRYLALPPALPERVAARARAWTAGAAGPREQAKLIQSHLRRDYVYDLESPSGAASNPLDHFLFESRRGHCEFYSTAMAVMLRTLGVPSRNVAGFIGGTYNRFGDFYAVRQGDAHSWVEVYIAGDGWRRFDPTPPSDAAPQSEINGALAFLRDLVEAAAQRWSRHVIGYDLPQQMQLLRSARRGYFDLRQSSPLIRDALASPRRLVAGISGLILLAVGVYWLSRRRRRHRARAPVAPSPQQISASQVVNLYKQLERAMATRGVPRQRGTPPLAHARALTHLRHPIASEVLDLTEIYQQVRFGGRHLDDQTRRSYGLRVRALKHAHAAPGHHADSDDPGSHANAA